MDGRTHDAAPQDIRHFVDETANPKNQRQVAFVNAFTPALAEWPGIRLVDTPGLGSIHAHNTETTRSWMPNAAAVLVTVSAERPLSGADVGLIIDARQTAPRVAVVLTKVDLLDEMELERVAAFVHSELCNALGATVPMLMFSTRKETARWVRELREKVFLPLAQDVAAAAAQALQLKVTALARSCRSYLTVGLQAAERVEADRQTLRAAVLNESVNAAVIQDELALVARRMRERSRPAFEKLAFARRSVRRAESSCGPRGGTPFLERQPRRPGGTSQRLDGERLAAEVQPLSDESARLASDLLHETEGRLLRVVEAFRDRLHHHVRETTGVSISAAAWELRQPALAAGPVSVGRTFMMSWELISWLAPMSVFGGLFRRHALGRVNWEVEKNLARLVSYWCEATDGAVENLRVQAAEWVKAELATLERLLGQQQPAAAAYRDAIRRLDAADSGETSAPADP